MKALIIDDEPNVRIPLTATIKLAGYDQIDTAATGEEALGLALRTRYDLITVDIQMPEVSGLEMLSVLRTIAPHAVIAIISAYTDQVTNEDAAHADLVLPKPFRVQTIRRLAHLTREIAQTRAALHALTDIPAPAGNAATDDAADDEPE